MNDMENISKESVDAFRGQTWDTAAYAATGRFVADLAGGVVELLAPQVGEAILDLGCGDGALTERIAAIGAVMTGADSSQAMVAAARVRGLTVHEVTADAMSFNGEFDAVFSNAALHWMPNADEVIAGGLSGSQAGWAIRRGDGRPWEHCCDSDGATGSSGEVRD